MLAADACLHRRDASGNARNLEEVDGEIAHGTPAGGCLAGAVVSARGRSLASVVRGGHEARRGGRGVGATECVGGTSSLGASPFVRVTQLTMTCWRRALASASRLGGAPASRLWRADLRSRQTRERDRL